MTVNWLKIIAISSMFVDHLAAISLYDSPYYLLFRAVGRLCFPIIAFLISEGFIHTQSMDKYLLRLGTFALLSEPIYDYAFYDNWLYWGSQNIFFTLVLGLLAIKSWKVMSQESKLQAGVVVTVLMLFAELIHSDYGMCGVLLIFLCYLTREKPERSKYVFYGGFILGNILLIFASFGGHSHNAFPFYQSSR